MANTFELQVDTENKITVESSILYANWKYLAAHAGGESEFEIGTSLVGEGAPIEIIARTGNGKKIGTCKGFVSNNRYFGTVEIPEKMRYDDTIYFNCKLPKHKLNHESNEIPVRPKILIISMQWNKYEVRRGETLHCSVKFVDGCIEDDSKATVVIKEYDSDKNHDIIAKIPAIIKKSKIDLDWEFQYVDDTDDIPTQEEMKKYGKRYSRPKYFFEVQLDGIVIGDQQESGLVKFKDTIVITAIKGRIPGEPQDYSISFADGSEIIKTTDKNGQIKLEDAIPGSFKVSPVIKT